MTAETFFTESGSSPPASEGEAARRLAARFLKFVKPDPETGCHIWVGAKHPGGYGCIGVNRADERAWLASRGVRVPSGGTVRSHVTAYGMYAGIIPPGAHVLHDCPAGDNTSCVRPSHLFAGTHAENMADRDAKGRNAHGDRHGCRLHPERVRRGEQHGNSKLTEDLVDEIRRLRAEGLSQRAIGAKVGVSHVQVGNILRGHSWKHHKSNQETKSMSLVTFAQYIQMQSHRADIAPLAAFVKEHALDENATYDMIRDSMVGSRALDHVEALVAAKREYVRLVEAAQRS